MREDEEVNKGGEELGEGGLTQRLSLRVQRSALISIKLQ